MKTLPLESFGKLLIIPMKVNANRCLSELFNLKSKLVGCPFINIYCPSSVQDAVIIELFYLFVISFLKICETFAWINWASILDQNLIKLDATFYKNMDVANDIKWRFNQLEPKLCYYHWKQVNLKEFLSFQWLFFGIEFDEIKRL